MKDAPSIDILKRHINHLVSMQNDCLAGLTNKVEGKDLKWVLDHEEEFKKMTEKQIKNIVIPIYYRKMVELVPLPKLNRVIEASLDFDLLSVEDIFITLNSESALKDRVKEIVDLLIEEDNMKNNT